MADGVEITVDEAIKALDDSQSGFSESESYFNASSRRLALSVAVPPSMRDIEALVGLPRVYVKAVAERLIIEGFRMGESVTTDETLWAWFKANSLDTAAMLSFIDSLVYGRSYVTISAPTDEDALNPLVVEGVPLIRVESPLVLYAKKDPRTREIVWAVRVVKDDTGQVSAATLYLPDRTEFYEKGNGEYTRTGVVAHNLGVVPVVDVTAQTSLTDLYGSSFITPELRSITDAISRVLMNLQTTSELMAAPQRTVIGATMDQVNPEELGAMEVYTATYMVLPEPDAKVMQLPAAELRNYTEAITHLMKLAAAYTGLPPQYLSFNTDNPASAEAIRSSETRLVRTCEALCAVFGDAWERVMRIAMLVMGQELTLDAFRMETVWRDPGTPTFQAKADAVTKLYGSGLGVIPLEQARVDMGYTPEQRRQMQVWDSQSASGMLKSLYGEGVTSESRGDDSTPAVGGESVSGQGADGSQTVSRDGVDS